MAKVNLRLENSCLQFSGTTHYNTIVQSGKPTGMECYDTNKEGRGGILFATHCALLPVRLLAQACESGNKGSNSKEVAYNNCIKISPLSLPNKCCIIFCRPKIFSIQNIFHEN